ITVMVGLVPTTIALTTGSAASLFSEPVTLTAVVAAGSRAPTGSVTFFADGNALGSAPLVAVGGQEVATVTTTAMAVGTHAMTAKFDAAGDFAAAQSSASPHVINSVPTTVTVAADPNPVAFGKPLTLTAAVGTPAVVTAP